MVRSSNPSGGSHDFSAHPRPQEELERLRRQALAAWPVEKHWLERLGLTDGMRVLDVGCGPGFVTRALARCNPNGETVGLEPDPALAQLARATFAGQPGLSLHVGSLAANRLPANHFDFAYARFVCQHLADPLEDLRALLGLLKPGAKVVLADADDGLTAFHPQPPELARIMRILEARQAHAGGDRRIGRKLPHLLREAGFTGVGFRVMPFTSDDLGRDALLELAVSSRLLRIADDEEPGIEALARRMHAFFRHTHWYGMACVVAAFGARPAAAAGGRPAARDVRGAEPQVPDGARLATTRDALEGVYRLRYDVYIRELGKGFLPVVDHDRGWVRDPEDEQDNVYVFYTGPQDAMTGTLRVQVWEPGCVPQDVFERFSLHLFPGIERYRVSEVARLVIRSEHRGGSVLSSLACAAFEHVASRHDVFVCFLYCSPGLLHPFARFGFRPYPALVIPNEDGIRVPMFMVASDLAHLQELGSPLALLLGRHLAAGRALPDLSPFLHAIRELPAHYETDPQRVFEEVRERLQPGAATGSPLLEGLTAGEVEALCRCGFVMEIPCDKVILREGLVERELYLVLTGRHEMRMADRKLAERGPGDVLGEVSFFREPGARVATVRSLTPGRVMVLERHFLQRLAPTHPQLASRVLFNLGRIVSGHLAMALEGRTTGR